MRRSDSLSRRTMIQLGAGAAVAGIVPAISEDTTPVQRAVTADPPPALLELTGGLVVKLTDASGDSAVLSSRLTVTLGRLVTVQIGDLPVLKATSPDVADHWRAVVRRLQGDQVRQIAEAAHHAA